MLVVAFVVAFGAGEAAVVGLAEDVGVLQQAAQLAEVESCLRRGVETVRGMAGKTFRVGLPDFFQLLGSLV